MNFYNISQLPDRQQTAEHFHSSLEQPTLQNVEAQLYVSRQRNYQLAAQYFQSKYGNSQLYDSYVQSHQLQGLGPAQAPQYDLKRQLEKKAMQIQDEQNQKYQAKRGRGGAEEQAYDSNDYRPNKSGKPRQNIWAPTATATQPKVKQQQPQPPQQGIRIDVDQEKQGAFMSEFKSYLTNKHKTKEEKQQQSPMKATGTMSQFKAASQSNVKQQKSYEEELVRKFFRDIVGGTGHGKTIEKLRLVEYLGQNSKILKVLGCSAEEASGTVMSIECKLPDHLNFNECLMFVYQIIGKTEEVKKIRAQQEFETVPPGCMLSPQLLTFFEETFRSLDRHSDLVVKRIPYIGRLTADPLVKKNLNLPAVYEAQLDRHVSLRRIFERIQIETLLASQQQKSVRQYISWSQFIGYFQSGHKQRGKYDLIVLLQSLKNEEKFGLSHLPLGVSEVISDGIKSADKGRQLLNTMDIINQIKLHPEYDIEKYTFIGRNQGVAGNTETFEDSLNRIKQKALRYVTPKEFMEYFTARGKPIQEEEKQKNANKYSAVKVGHVQDQFQKEEPDGYDSDPQIYNGSKLVNKPSMEFRKSQKQLKRFNNTAQSFIEPNLTDDDRSKQMKVTIPQPFSFDSREKQRKLRKERQTSQQSYSPEPFKAKPVPSNVTQVGLYDKIREDQKKKNQERKRCSMIMTLANEQPFSFETRKANKKTKAQREKFIFTAKPIPWYCSVELLNRKKEEEIVRNERIAKLAQENLAKARLPPRMEKDFLQKEAKKAQAQTQGAKRPASAQAKVKPPPDFNKMHKNFEEAMERKRKQHKTTQVEEFRWTSTSKMGNISKVQADAQNAPNIPKAREVPKSTKAQVDIFAQSTAKFTQQVEKRRKEMDEKRKKEEVKKKEDEDRKKIDQDLKRKIVGLVRGEQPEERADPKDEAKQANDQQREVFKSWKEERIANGRKQPLLVERDCKRKVQIEKMKRLHDISKTLKGNGITGKDHDHYFKREELLLIQDYLEYLKKEGEPR